MSIKPQNNPVKSLFKTSNKTEKFNEKLIKSPSGTKPEYVPSKQMQMHPKWPQLPERPEELFLECNVFLYSIIALFLQYLNLYKTIWWLPNSYWPTSFKAFMINPYLLSCVGIFLGIRVAKCFWNKFTKYFSSISQSKIWTIIEYGVVKMPNCIIILYYFVYSFSKVYFEYSFKALFYFMAIPLFSYLFLLCTNFDEVKKEDEIQNSFDENSSVYKFLKPFLKLPTFFAAMFRSNLILDLDIVKHMCTNDSRQIRDEADELAKDFFKRLKHSIFGGLFNAYFSIFIPYAFLPDKSSFGLVQHLLVDNTWVFQLFTIVAFTSFSIYFTYLLPLQYFNLLQKHAFHLGSWQQLKTIPNEGDNVMEFSEDLSFPNLDKQIIRHNGKFYKAMAAKNALSVSAMPGNLIHYFVFKLGNDPLKFLKFSCLFQLSIILFQFWLLILSKDWHHFVTLGILMLANFLLLGKKF